MSDQDKNIKHRFRFRHLPVLIKDTAISWNKDDPWRLSAIVAYYAILSLPGLLVIIISMLGYFWGAEIIEGQVYEEIRSSMGQSTAFTWVFTKKYGFKMQPKSHARFINKWDEVRP